VGGLLLNTADWKVYRRQKQRQIFKHIMVLMLRRLNKDSAATTYVQHFMPSSSSAVASHISTPQLLLQLSTMKAHYARGHQAMGRTLRGCSEPSACKSVQADGSEQTMVQSCKRPNNTWATTLPVPGKVVAHVLLGRLQPLRIRNQWQNYAARSKYPGGRSDTCGGREGDQT